MFPQLNRLLAVYDIPMPEGSGDINLRKGDFWFPEQASSFAKEVDFLYYAIFWISTIFFIGICYFMFYFAWKYRRVGGLKGEIKPQKSSSHNTALEIFWSVIPSVILVWIFYTGAKGFFEMRVPTDDCEEIHVKAQKWNWSFTYPNGDQTTELHLVLDKPVKLVMQSPDVLHSMYIPAFRQKMDIVPGRYTYAYLTPTREGEFRLACTEYCGDEHSRMRTTCVVHETEELREKNTEWIRSSKKYWENGERLYKMNCSGCHKVDGTAATGPALNKIWGETERYIVKGETTVTEGLVDEQYIQESIWYPEAKVVEGYPDQMQAFAGKLKPDDINDIIAYLKWLKDPETYGNDKSVVGLPGGGEAGTEPEADSEVTEPETTEPAPEAGTPEPAADPILE